MSNKTSLYIGLMSGTSADGIDLALVKFDDDVTQHANGATLIASYYQAYDKLLHNRIVGLYEPGHSEIDRLGSLDIELATLFSKAINTFIAQQNLTTSDITAIASHGQTIRHRPTQTDLISTPFTLQIGCLQTLATLTDIRVIGDFRRKDLILGGQGAPLVPAFHRAIFNAQDNDVFVANIGGIANITYIPQNASESTAGFDTGPGNALLDFWYQQHHSEQFDNGGKWAASGKVNQDLLKVLLQDPYFNLAAPKSTGREYFNAHWLAQFSLPLKHRPADIQATLSQLTATSIAQEITKLSQHSTVYICGGGAYNNTLISMLKKELPTHNILNTHTENIDSDSLEAMAFAWLGYAFDKNICGNIPAATGARKKAVLGISVEP